MFLPLTDWADSLFLFFLCSKPPVKFLSSVLGKSNLQFSGMNIKLTISTSSLTLINADSQQVGSMYSGSFSPCYSFVLEGRKCPAKGMQHPLADLCMPGEAELHDASEFKNESTRHTAQVLFVHDGVFHGEGSLSSWQTLSLDVFACKVPINKSWL